MSDKLPDISSITGSKKHSTAVFTVVHPASSRFFPEFLRSLQNQTCTEFDIFLINDNAEDIERQISECEDLNFLTAHVSLGIAKNREIGLRYIRELQYENLIFCDSDDTFSGNRIERTLYCLKNADIVVNDVSLINPAGEVILDRYFEHRIPEGSVIRKDFILTRNIFGLSNTAVKVSLLRDIILPDDLIAVDWYLFTLLLQNHSAVFTSAMQTFYRQYDMNTAGMKKPDEEGIRKALQVKCRHYENLRHLHPEYEILYNSCRTALSNSMNSTREGRQFMAKIIEKTPEFPFWWEFNFNGDKI